MTLYDVTNLIFVLLSIGLGAIGWLAPRYVMGVSEVRASAGALFVGLGVGAVLVGTPDAYAILGAAWMGAAVGRVTSIILDGPTPKKWGFFISEVVVGLGALAINL